jgi:putative tryptophan/tyrosine transport system substrate-binding protein
LVTKQLQLLQGLLPASGVIGVLVDPSKPNAASDTAQVQEAAALLRLKVQVVHTAAQRDLDAAFDDFGRAQTTAVLVFPDALFSDVRGRLAELATRYKLPVLYPDRSYAEVGGLMSYGSSRSDAFAKPASMSVGF